MRVYKCSLIMGVGTWLCKVHPTKITNHVAGIAMATCQESGITPEAQAHWRLTASESELESWFKFWCEKCGQLNKQTSQLQKVCLIHASPFPVSTQYIFDHIWTSRNLGQCCHDATMPAGSWRFILHRAMTAHSTAVCKWCMARLRFDISET